MLPLLLGALLITLLGCATAGSSKSLLPTSMAHSNEKLLPGGDLRVAIQRPDLTLVGRLALPRRRGNVRVPAVVLIAGSGPSAADCKLPGQAGMTFASPVPLCADLTEALCTMGVAVLRYDKRTCGKFNHCADNEYPRPPDSHTIFELVDDVRAAIAYLRTRGEVDPERIFVLGHSEGGSYVPILLHDDARLAGGIMVAAAYRDVDALLMEQALIIHALVEKTGGSAEAADAAVSDMLLAADQVARLRDGKPVAEQILHTPSPYWASWLALSRLARDSAPVVSQPLLLLGGAYDFNVPTTELDLWRAALAHDRRHRISKLPCITHALNCITEPNPLLVRRQHIGVHVADAVTEAIQTFVYDVVTRPGARR